MVATACVGKDSNSGTGEGSGLAVDKGTDARAYVGVVSTADGAAVSPAISVPCHGLASRVAAAMMAANAAMPSKATGRITAGR
jgi:hypothetical protein